MWYLALIGHFSKQNWPTWNNGTHILANISIFKIKWVEKYTMKKKKKLKTYSFGLKEFWGPPPYSIELVGDTFACCTELTLRVFGLGLRLLMEDMTLPKKGTFRRVFGSSSPIGGGGAEKKTKINSCAN